MAPRVVYLDNMATTPVDPRVLDAMLPFFTERFGNPSSSHAFGIDAESAVERARDQIAAMVHTTSENVVFTSGATEANNLAIQGLMKSHHQPAELIVSAAEHRAVLDPAARLRRSGVGVTTVAVGDDSRVSPDEIAGAMTEDTRLVCVMLVNNETGAINDVAEIAARCRQRGVAVHCDAAQALGKIPIDIRDLGADFLSLSAHKAYGPKGVGALCLNPDSNHRMQGLLFGGGHERGLRSGTLPVPLIVGFAAACQLADELMDDDNQRIEQLRDRLRDQLRRGIAGLIENSGTGSHSIAHALNVSVPDVDGDVLWSHIQDVAVSAGSACSSNDPEPSHVLRAMGRTATLARSSLRIGFGRFNSESEVAASGEHLVAAVESARRQCGSA